VEPLAKSRKKTVTLSIKNVPDKLVKRLRHKAAIHKRSLQGELMALLEDATSPTRLTVDELEQALRRFRPIPGDSTRMIREERDAR
jgi:plasmid stability protein